MLTAVGYPATEEIFNKIKIAQILCVTCINWNSNEVPVLYSVIISVTCVSPSLPLEALNARGTRSPVLNCLFGFQCLRDALSADELSREGHGQIQVTLQEGGRGLFHGVPGSCPLGTSRKGFCVNSFSCSVPQALIY